MIMSDYTECCHAYTDRSIMEQNYDALGLP